MNIDAGLTEFELAATMRCLGGEAEWQSVLREQVLQLRVVSREYNSAGGWLGVRMPVGTREALIPSDVDLPLGVLVKHRALLHDGAFQVWLHGGNIDALEAVAFGDGSWPDPAKSEISEFTFSELPPRLQSKSVTKASD